MNRSKSDATRVRIWQKRLHEIIFEAETPAGRAFDVLLLTAILLSIMTIMLESVSAYREFFGIYFRAIEWAFTIIFTVEYILRILCVPRPFRYMCSFYGLVDFFSIAPTYLSLYFAGTQSLLIIRALRLLRIFRVLKLARFLGEADTLARALRASRVKIIVFLGVILTMVTIMGTIMYLVEGADAGFTSIPKSMYWAIVTMTTVGYGDITPQTTLGQSIAAIIMILGYGVLAVPTGIVTSELTMAKRLPESAGCTRVCDNCHLEGHGSQAKFCRSCGFLLH